MKDDAIQERSDHAGRPPSCKSFWDARSFCKHKPEPTTQKSSYKPLRETRMIMGIKRSVETFEGFAKQLTHKLNTNEETGEFSL